MKLTYFQLEPHLAKQLKPIYLISSDEALLKQDVTQLLRQAATKAGYNEHTRTAPEAMTAEDIHAALYSHSLFANRRLIEIDFRDGTPTKDITLLLGDYAKQPIADNVVILLTSKLDDKTTRSAWHHAIEQTGVVLTIWPVSREQLPQWIMTRAKKYRLVIPTEAASLLSDYVEGNLIAAAQVIEKASLLFSTTDNKQTTHHILEYDTLKQLLADENRFTVFDLVDALIAGNSLRAIQILNFLQADGTDPVLALWAVTRECRLLSELAHATKQGSALEPLFQKHRVFPRRQPALRQFVSRHTGMDCRSFLTHAAQIDRILKGATPGNPWDAFQLLCLRMQA